MQQCLPEDLGCVRQISDEEERIGKVPARCRAAAMLDGVLHRFAVQRDQLRPKAPVRIRWFAPRHVRPHQAQVVSGLLGEPQSPLGVLIGEVDVRASLWRGRPGPARAPWRSRSG